MYAYRSRRYYRMREIDEKKSLFVEENARGKKKRYLKRISQKKKKKSKRISSRLFRIHLLCAPSRCGYVYLRGFRISSCTHHVRTRYRDVYNMTDVPFYCTHTVTGTKAQYRMYINLYRPVRHGIGCCIYVTIILYRHTQ